MMQPKRTKFRKAFKGRIHGLAKGGTDLNFGAYGMKVVEPGPDHRPADRGGAACDHPAPEARRPGLDPRVPGRAGVEEAGRGPHGQGQGLGRALGRRVKPGRIMFEIDGVAEELAAEAIRLGAAKLPLGHALRAARAAGRGGGVMKAADLRAQDPRPAAATSSCS